MVGMKSISHISQFRHMQKVGSPQKITVFSCEFESGQGTAERWVHQSSCVVPLSKTGANQYHSGPFLNLWIGTSWTPLDTNISKPFRHWTPATACWLQPATG